MSWCTSCYPDTTEFHSPFHGAIHVLFTPSRAVLTHFRREGRRRSMTAPKGIHVIRAPPLRQKDVGDDAIVERVHAAVKEDIDPSRLVLITDDKGLIRRMPWGVRRRSPHWLACEIVNFLAETELGHRPSLTLPMAGEVKNSQTVRIEENLQAKPASLESRGLWRHWLGSLMRLPTLLWSSVGSNQNQDHQETARRRSFERS